MTSIVRSCAASLVLVATVLTATATPAAAAFTTFESGAVRPLALSPDGTRLVACNTPDNRIEVFDVDAGGLTHAASVPVGLEPVAVAARTNTEIWVVNHLSDSISIVDLATTPPRVTRTLLVGDEPRDLVFAGPGRTRAFITTAHRGQNSSLNPQLTTPGVGRADVWVFDATNLGSSLGGTPLTIVTLFGDTPRALAVSPSGNTVYAAVFHSGNRTTTVTEGVVCDGGAGAGPCVVGGVTYPGGLPAPNENIGGVPGPETGLIARFNGTQWVDTVGRDWSNAVRFNLPDKDVFAIDATANPPTAVSGPAGFAAGVGTILFNMVTNPVSGRLYVSNTEANNLTRFEGPGGGGSTVLGHLHEARITVLDGVDVLPRHLNKHINYTVHPAPAGVKDKSLATPVDMVVSGDGSTLYVAAFGSSKVGVFNTAQLENDTFVPSAATHISVSGGGPVGLALDEARDRLYVLTRFDNGIAVVDTTSNTEVDHVSLYNPEPTSVVNGRRFLYDAFLTSSNGEAACGACHVFGDLDSLAWDLGNPDDAVLNNPNPFRLGPAGDPDFHPMKGPMTTQSLRGMANHGPMHWRGDRTGGNDVGGNALDEDAAFKKFNVAFEGLLGRTAPLTTTEMQAFTDFILQVTYPPNPIRNLDNSLTTQQGAGRTFYLNRPTDGGALTCNACHVLNPGAGFFGSDGFSSFENEPQHMKVAHLRNMYQKVGMFGMPVATFVSGGGSNAHQGDQIRGFGFLHDGSVDTVFRFLSATVFAFAGGDPERRQVESFVLAFDTNLAPIVGQQITLTNANGAAVGPRIDLLVQRAAAGECELTVKGTLAGEARGWFRTVTGQFQSDRAAESPIADATLRGHATTAGQERTYLCVPPGSGVRVGVDRDEDTYFDRDELDAGSDPADAGSVPLPPPTPTPAPCAGGQPVATARFKVTRNQDPAGDESLTISGDATLSPAIDPIANGVTFQVQNLNGEALYGRSVPGGTGWTVNSAGTRWTFNDRKGLLTGSPITVTISDRSSRTPGLYKVKIRATKGAYQVASAALPVRVVLTFGPVSGQCSTRAFSPSGGTPPACTLSRTGSTVSCR